MKLKLLLLTSILFISITSYAQIISSELMATWSLDEVSDLYDEFSIPESASQINYPVDGYKILYMTPDYNGELTICSGAIFLPSGINCPPPLISWQHGTESNDQGAPSNVGNNYNDLIGVVCASGGYIVTMSDFIGLGEGEGIHNYMHAQTEATATIDLILYGKQFANDMLGTPTNDQLFLFGYSQGGHATMATVKEIEANYSEELTITASAPMAGPYSMSEIQSEMLESGLPYPNPGYLPYLIFSYNKIYNIYEDINDALISPYNTFLYDMYDGSYDMWEINNELPSTPIDIFQEDYYQEYLNNNNHPLRLALIDNDVYDFVPQSPMRLIHCSGDDNVAYESSELAYNYFITNGAQNIELIDGGNFNHEQCASIAILGGKLWIDTYAELCQPTQVIELNNQRKKTIINTVDLIGRKTQKDNPFLINIYSDGSHQKKFQTN